MRSQDETHYLGDGCLPPHAMGTQPPVGIEPPGPEIRHLTVTTGDIDRLLGWYATAFSGADERDEALARYLREMRDRTATE